MALKKDPTKKTFPTRELARKAGVPRAHIDQIFQVIVDECLDGNYVVITDIGKFWMKVVPARTRIVPNWRTGEKTPMAFPATHKFRFTPCAALKKSLGARTKGMAESVAGSVTP
jgi:nucleoid DNA-binding protein